MRRNIAHGKLKQKINFRFMVTRIVFYIYIYIYIYTKCPTSSNSATVMWPAARSWTIFKRTLPQSSRPNVTYVVPVAVNCSYCTPDDGYGKYPKHIQWSCNKIKILLLHLVGHFVCVYTENKYPSSAGVVQAQLKNSGYIHTSNGSVCTPSVHNNYCFLQSTIHMKCAVLITIV
jgi:hypothetical protein